MTDPLPFRVGERVIAHKGLMDNIPLGTRGTVQSVCISNNDAWIKFDNGETKIIFAYHSNLARRLNIGELLLDGQD